MARTKGSKNTAPDLDLTALAVEVVEAPKQTRQVTEKPNPFRDWLRDSKSSGTARAVTVPEAQVKAAQNAIRRAASALNIGVRIWTENAGGGRTRVGFVGQEKRNYTKSASNGA